MVAERFKTLVQIQVAISSLQSLVQFPLGACIYMVENIDRVLVKTIIGVLQTPAILLS